MNDEAIRQAFEEGTVIDRAVTRAFFAAVQFHRMHGVPMALWKDGKVWYVDAHDIALPDEHGPRGTRTADA